ncbi:MAG: GHKL domain-containing protein [Clostridiaceae bacterium]|nr:GHKL domain-containing protein [Clostridiaceae bacterium]HNR04805.1 GHKL domain-containing protein [Bacillota bacterium]HNT02177.1 GHKL domain-containing protein [Bacillota bacterium]
MMILYKIFINTIGMVLFAYLAQALYNFQREKKVFIKFIIYLAICTNILFYLDKYIGAGVRAIAVLLMMMLMSYFVLKLNVLQSIVVNITNGIALVIGDISAVFIMVKIYGYTHEMIKSNIMLSLIADLIIFGMYIIIILLIKFFKQTQEMADKYKRKNSIRTSLYMLVTFIIIVVNYTTYINFIGVASQNIILINVAIMWLYLILSLYINFTNSALALKEQQYDQQQDYIRTIDNLINDFRRLKHSYANTIYGFFGYIQEDDLEGLKAYYTEVADEAKRMDSNLLLALQRIKVYAVFGLLWNKINEAEGRGIEVGIRVTNEIREVGMKLTELCEVLGNYLDNAIDAAAASMDKKMNITLTDGGGYLTISIENTYEGDVDVKEIQKKGYSTKGNERGFGLSITNHILSGYTNILHNTFAEDGIFKQELVIKK